MASSPAGMSYSLLGQTSLGAVFMPVNAKGVVTTVPAHPGTNSGQRASLLINTPDGFKPITAKADTKRAFHELGLARQDLRGKKAALISDGTAALVKFRTKMVTSSHEGIVHRTQEESGARTTGLPQIARLLNDVRNLDVAGIDARFSDFVAAMRAANIEPHRTDAEWREAIFFLLAHELRGASFERRNQVLDQLEAKFYAHGNAMPTEMRRYFDSLREMSIQDAVPFMWRSLLTGTAIATALAFVGATEVLGVFGLATAWANVMSWGAEIYVPNSRHVPHGSKLSDASMALSFLAAGTLIPMMTVLGGWSDYPVLTAFAASLAVYGSSMRYGASKLSRSVLGQQPAVK